MNPLVAQHLAELRNDMDASIVVVEDLETAIVVRVTPVDDEDHLPPFLLRIDPMQYYSASGPVH